MPTPHSTYTTRDVESYLADAYGIVSVSPHHVTHLVSMGGIPLPPIVKHDDGSTTPWVDPRIVAASTTN
jgi:hypothetical protein